MKPQNADLLYTLRLYWDHSLIWRGVIALGVLYGLWTFAIVVVETLRENFKRPIPKFVSNQLVCCWATCFFLIAAVLIIQRQVEPIPLR